MIAKDILHRAYEEYARGKASNDRLLMQEAAEKAWLAVVQATDTFLAANHRSVEKGPNSHIDRKEELNGLGRGDLELRYSHLAGDLHGDCFYNGRLKQIEVLLAEAEQLVEALEA